MLPYRLSSVNLGHQLKICLFALTLSQLLLPYVKRVLLDAHMLTSFLSASPSLKSIALEYGFHPERKRYERV